MNHNPSTIITKPEPDIECTGVEPEGEWPWSCTVKIAGGIHPSAEDAHDAGKVIREQYERGAGMHGWAAIIHSVSGRVVYTKGLHLKPGSTDRSLTRDEAEYYARAIRQPGQRASVVAVGAMEEVS